MHTKGPWRWEVSDRAPCRLVGSDGTVILTATGEEGAEGDDYLIAAAPDLLSALYAICSAAEYMEFDPDSRFGMAMNQAEAAIEKATK